MKSSYNPEAEAAAAKSDGSSRRVKREFTIGLGTSSFEGHTVSFKYRAYYKFKDSNGITHTVYSDTITVEDMEF